MRQVFTSVDIGTDTIKVIMTELIDDKLNLLASSLVESQGVIRGEITNYEKALESLKTVMADLTSIAPASIDEVIMNVSSSLAKYRVVKGSINVEGIISKEDINSLFQVAFDSVSLNNEEMVTMQPINFSVDDNNFIKEPLGQVGTVFSVNAMLITVPTANLTNHIRLMFDAGYEVSDISISGLSDYFTFKNMDLDAKSGAIVNIGADTTIINYFTKGIMFKNEILDMAGKNVDKDISYVYKIGMDEAKYVKEELVNLDVDRTSNKETLTITDDVLKTSVIIKQTDVSKIALSRVEEIEFIINKNITEALGDNLDFVIITGGSSNLTNIHKALTKRLNSAIIGSVEMTGLRNNKYSTVLGNVVYFISKLRLKGDIYEFKESQVNLEEESTASIGKFFTFFLNDEEDN